MSIIFAVNSSGSFDLQRIRHQSDSSYANVTIVSAADRSEPFDDAQSPRTSEHLSPLFKSPSSSSSSSPLAKQNDLTMAETITSYKKMKLKHLNKAAAAAATASSSSSSSSKKKHKINSIQDESAYLPRILVPDPAVYLPLYGPSLFNIFKIQILPPIGPVKAVDFDGSLNELTVPLRSSAPKWQTESQSSRYAENQIDSHQISINPRQQSQLIGNISSVMPISKRLLNSGATYVAPVENAYEEEFDILRKVKPKANNQNNRSNNRNNKNTNRRVIPPPSFPVSVQPKEIPVARRIKLTPPKSVPKIASKPKPHSANPPVHTPFPPLPPPSLSSLPSWTNNNEKNRQTTRPAPVSAWNDNSNHNTNHDNFRSSVEPQILQSVTRSNFWNTLPPSLPSRTTSRATSRMATTTTTTTTTTRRPTVRPTTRRSSSSSSASVRKSKSKSKSTDPLAADRCTPNRCTLPHCNCAGATIPGDLRSADIPQLVMITFDDSINDLNWDIYREIFSSRVNPNGCPILGTFYVSHEWTDYSQVQTLYAEGHEMASHTITHSFGNRFSKEKWLKEVSGQREILHLYGGVKYEDVRGMRAPFLQPGGNNQFEMLYEANFTYDSSLPVFENNPPYWPYTFDYALGHECMITPCPSHSFPGLWEVGMVMLIDHRGGRCSMVDACSHPSTEMEVYENLLKNFNRHYQSNRAPFGLYFHSAWFNTQHYRLAFLRFIDEINRRNDVYFVTKWQMLQWMQQPTPLSRLRSFRPFQCNQYKNRKPCPRPTVCNAQFRDGPRYLKTCQKCPKVYPWVGNTGFERKKRSLATN